MSDAFDPSGRFSAGEAEQLANLLLIAGSFPEMAQWAWCEFLVEAAALKKPIGQITLGDLADIMGRKGA